MKRIHTKSLHNTPTTLRQTDRERGQERGTRQRKGENLGGNLIGGGGDRALSLLSGDSPSCPRSHLSLRSLWPGTMQKKPIPPWCWRRGGISAVGFRGNKSKNKREKEQKIAPEVDRTPDLKIFSLTLSQLSYRGNRGKKGKKGI